MFAITRGTGFHITAGDYTVSVQFGPGNYCENHDEEVCPEDEKKKGNWKAATAEVAFWKNSDHGMISFGSDTVIGWRTPAQVIAFLAALQAGDETGAIAAIQTGDEN